MNEAKRASADHPIQPAVAERWSPYAFDPTPVPAETVRSLFEAARWAPSGFNEQPWRYLVATRDEPAEFERLLSCLVEKNAEWARFAPVLALGVASRRYARNDRPNETALHDLGAASATLALEASARGLAVHQMGGILPDRARELYGVPEGFDVVTALAIGAPGRGEDLPDGVAQRDRASRRRRPLDETVFGESWGRPAPVLTD